MSHDGVAILVALKAPTARAVRVDVTLPEDLLVALDRHAEANGYTRSGLLALAARRAMEAA